MRDEFKKSVIENLAKRVGNRCSNPNCQTLTSGPHTEDNKTINVGVAAHITAASEGGPRYNATLSSDSRKEIENGIWLCQICAKLVDNDQRRFTEALLRQWKAGAEQRALSEIESPRSGQLLHGTFCIETHNNTVEKVCISDCIRFGKPLIPPWLNTDPDRMCSDWLVDRLASNAELGLFLDPKWEKGIYFVADLRSGDGVVINEHQFGDLKPPSPTTTTTTTTTASPEPTPAEIWPLFTDEC